MSHIVKCRICKQAFDTELLDKDLWTMPSKGWYYHKECYTNWKVSSTHDDEEWKLLIYDFLARDLKVSYNYHMCEAQRKKFISQNKYTNKGIYFTLKYFYELQKGEWDKGKGGIGIIPFVYKEATEYWTKLEIAKRGTMAMIEEQIKAKLDRPVRTLTKNIEKNKSKWNLDDF